MRRLLLAPLLFASLLGDGNPGRWTGIPVANPLWTEPLYERAAEEPFAGVAQESVGAVANGSSGEGAEEISGASSGEANTPPQRAFDEGGLPALLAPIVGLAAGPLGSAIRGPQSSTSAARVSRPFELDAGPAPRLPASSTERARPLRPDIGLRALRSAWTTGTPPPPHSQT